MARQIKFRGKSAYGGVWFYGSYVHLPDSNSHHIIPCGTYKPHVDAFSVEQVEINPNTVGQYTGCDDRNGTPIYEGDIVDLYDEDCGKPGGLCGSRLEVAFSDDEARFAYTNRVPGHEYTMGFDKRWRDNIYVVIGNIYDNPEILNQQ